MTVEAMSDTDPRQPSAHGTLVERFAAQRNIIHFEELLRNESDPNECRILKSMLNEERAKLAAAEAASSTHDSVIQDATPAAVIRSTRPIQAHPAALTATFRSGKADAPRKNSWRRPCHSPAEPFSRGLPRCPCP